MWTTIRILFVAAVLNGTMGTIQNKKACQLFLEKRNLPIPRFFPSIKKFDLVKNIFSFMSQLNT
jgi:hypothetical protein